MIANRLNVLMAERQLTIKDVVEGTELSRNTISNLINKNMSNSVNLSTLNSLCMFLNVSPKDFFVYSPFDIHFLGSSYGVDENNSFKISFIVHHLDNSFLIEDTVKVKIPKTLENIDSKEKKIIPCSVIYASQNYYDEPLNEPLSSVDKLKRATKFINQQSDESLDKIINSLDIMFQKVTKTMIENKLEDITCNLFHWKRATKKQGDDDTTNIYLVSYSFPWGYGKNHEYVKA